MESPIMFMVWFGFTAVIGSICVMASTATKPEWNQLYEAAKIMLHSSLLFVIVWGMLVFAFLSSKP